MSTSESRSTESWTVRRVLDWIEGYLREHGDSDPKLSARWLVSETLGCTRIELFTNLERVLSPDERNILRSYTARRGAGEPLQYITGTTGFRFLTLSVKPGVLIPRPETEVLVSELLAEIQVAFPESSETYTEGIDVSSLESATLEYMDDGGLYLQPDTGEPIPVEIDADGDVVLRTRQSDGNSLLVVDMCTGSGNIACSVAQELPHTHVIALDVSPIACELAHENVDSLGLSSRVDVVQSDMGASFPQVNVGSVDAVVSNPPYIPTEELAHLDSEVSDFEPHLALDGGADGLGFYRQLLVFAYDVLRKGGVLAVELHETTLDQAAQMAQDSGFSHVRVANDLANRPRILVARKS